VTLKTLVVVQIKDRTLLKTNQVILQLVKVKDQALKKAGSCDSNHPRKHHTFALFIIFSFPALKNKSLDSLL